MTRIRCTKSEPNRATRRLAPDFSTTPAILAGHSHMFALTGLSPVQGYGAAGTCALQPVGKIAGLQALHGPWPREEDYWSRLRELSRGPGDFAVCLAYRGNDHLAKFLLEVDRPIDFLSADMPDAGFDPSADLVPDALLEDLFTRLYAPLPGLLDDLVATGRRVLLLASPAPKNDPEFLRGVLAHEEYFMAVCRHYRVSIDAVRFSSSSLKTKLWTLLQRIQRRFAQQSGAYFVEVPPISIANGGLKPVYWQRDCTHANARYGQLVLRHVARTLAGNASPSRRKRRSGDPE